MKTIAIIQARMGSKRLPGKVLKDVCGKPLLFYVVSRTRLCPLLHEVVVATSDQESDNAIAQYCSEQGIPFFRGDHDDVLKRYAAAAAAYQADAIVRITADCPFIDPEVSCKVVERYQGGEFDYVSNVLKRTYPRGLDTEIFSREILEQWNRDLRDAEDREHVTRYVRLHLTDFRTASVTHEEDFSPYRWTVDTEEDLAFTRTVYGHFRHHQFSWRDVLQALEDHPEWRRINEHIEKQHSYL